jgi:hypothetical protein
MELMSEVEWRKLDAIEHVVEGNWTMEMGASAAGLSKRQFRRLRRKYESASNKQQAVVHGNTGRLPWNHLKDSELTKVLGLREKLYAGFNDTHFTEKLVEVHRVRISRQSVQRLLRSKQIVSPRCHKGKKRRKRRERRSRAGWMVLWDGSTHDWLEGRGPRLCLMGGIDDATGKILRGAHFVEHECSAGYLRVLSELVRHHGIPLEIYADKHSCLRRNDEHWSLEEQLAGRQEPPQVQRAAETLGIEIIWANSPQAKGRIERAWGTFQDRLVSDLRLAGATTAQQANAVLERYRRDHNHRFARQPKDKKPAWRKLAKGLRLEEICAFHTTAKVGNNSTVLYQNQVFDLAGPTAASIAGKTAHIRHLLNGQLRIYVDEQLVHHSRLAAPTKAPVRRRKRAPSVNSAKQRSKRKLTFKQILVKHKGTTQIKVA